MNERNFRMRMFSKYEDSENTVSELEVEVWEDEEWRSFDLNVRSPGFLIFVTVICFNVIGDALRDCLDPMLKSEGER